MTRHRCPDCRQPVNTTLDAPVAGLPITLHPNPVPREYALLAIVAGHQAAVADDSRHHTGWFTLTARRIGNPRIAQLPHYVEHVCGVTPPEAPPPPPIDTPPPWWEEQETP